MLTKVEIRPNVGSPITLNTTDGSGNHLYPLSHFSVETPIDANEFRKMAAAGEWPSFGYPGAMAINAEGHILGIPPTATEDYITKRLALLNAVLPPKTAMTARKHGVLRVRYDGMTEDADADIQLVSQSMPMEALYPAISEFQLQWKGFVPWFVGVSTSTQYYLG